MFFFMADIFEVLALTTPHTTSRSPMKRPASKRPAAAIKRPATRTASGITGNDGLWWDVVNRVNGDSSIP